MGVKERVFI